METQTAQFLGGGAINPRRGERREQRVKRIHDDTREFNEYIPVAKATSLQVVNAYFARNKTQFVWFNGFDAGTMVAGNPKGPLLDFLIANLRLVDQEYTEKYLISTKSTPEEDAAMESRLKAARSRITTYSDGWTESQWCSRGFGCRTAYTTFGSLRWARLRGSARVGEYRLCDSTLPSLARSRPRWCG